MVRHPHPLPDSLGAAFTMAEARAAGVDSRRLRHDDILHVYPGMCVRREVALRSVNTEAHKNEVWAQTITGVALSLASKVGPHSFYSHHTAAALWELPVSPPDANHWTLDITGCELVQSRRSGNVRYWRIATSQVSTVVHRGVRVTDPATTWAMLAPKMKLEDAVALGDAVLRHPRFGGRQVWERDPLALISDLERVATTPQRRGGKVLRELLPWLSHQSASPPESHIRVRLRQWGAPTPKLDYDVRSDDGEFLGCSEFAYPELKIVIEYEGAHHFSLTKQYERDLQKYRDYERHGWHVIRVDKNLLYLRPEELRAEVFRVLASRGWQLLPGST